jgi:predicted DCC family thiol-disulfide oxidoreductase YuxK
MKRRITIYYDPDCGFCEKACVSIRRFLFLKNTDIDVITSNEEANRIFQKEYSWVVYEEGTNTYFSKSTAWWRLVRASPFFPLYVITYIPRVIWLGDRIYDEVANNRPKTCTS